MFTNSAGNQAKPFQFEFAGHATNPRKGCNNLEDITLVTGRKVLDDGWVVNYMAQPLERAAAPYAYTTGRAMPDRPELLISGPFDPTELHAMLDTAVEIDELSPLTVGKVITIGERTFKVAHCDPSPLHAGSAVFGTGRFYAFQLLWPTPDGAFPGEPNYDIPDTVQTIYGED